MGDGEVHVLHPAAPDAAYRIRSTLVDAYQDAEAAMRASLARLSIADVLRDTLAQFLGSCSGPNLF